MIEAVAEILDPAVAQQAPLEGFDVLDRLADAEGHEEMRPDPHELHEDGVAVKLVEVGEILGERTRIQRVEPGVGEGVGFGIVFVKGEDIGEFGGRFQTDVDVVAEDETVPADGEHVARHAVVLCGDAFGGDQGGLNGAEDGLALRVQFPEPLAEIGAVGQQPIADNFVGAALQPGGGRGVRLGGGSGWGFL